MTRLESHSVGRASPHIKQQHPPTMENPPFSEQQYELTGQVCLWLYLVSDGEHAIAQLRYYGSQKETWLLLKASRCSSLACFRGRLAFKWSLADLRFFLYSRAPRISLNGKRNPDPPRKNRSRQGEGLQQDGDASNRKHNKMKSTPIQPAHRAASLPRYDKPGTKAAPEFSGILDGGLEVQLHWFYVIKITPGRHVTTYV
ncbi:UNVERIFIED_CONTAM: hypothetical protein FKN15_023973 [Acipenser sinensis]